MAQIHPFAVVHPEAVVGKDTEVGPFAVIEAGVVIGEGCKIAARASIKRGTILGKNNVLHEGAVLGGRPQHLGAPAEVGRLIVGDNNHFREHVTVHVGLTSKDVTTIGHNCLLMINVHIAHDCHLGDNVIMANNSMLAGHVSVGERAYISGAVGVHQFCRVGAYTMVGGQSHISQDIPPYVTVDGVTSLIVGLNKIGLKRAGFSDADMQQLKDAYRVIYRSGLRWSEVQAALSERFTTGPASAFTQFFAEGKRGFVQERRTPPKATLRLAGVTEESKDDESRKVG